MRLINLGRGFNGSIQRAAALSTACALSVDAAITCDNDGASNDGTLTNGPINSGDLVSLDIGTVTGTVTQLTVTVTYTVDAQ